MIHEISSTPVAPGSHGLKLNVKLGKGSPIRSGMTCKLKFVPYLKKDAVWVPKSSTFPSDESGTTFVYLHRKDRKPKKLKIQTGKRSGDKIEVLGGLRPGTEILLEKPGK